MLRIQSNRPATPEDFSGLSVEELTSRANEFLQDNNLSDAYPLLAQLTESADTAAGVHVTAGLVALQLDNPVQAREHLLRGVEVDPNDFDANYNLALVEVMLERSGEALSRLKRLRRLDPDNSALLNDMAVIWSDIRQPGRALGAFARALKIDPNDSRARNNAMRFCLEQNLLEPGRKLLLRQQRSDRLTDLSRAEVNRWQEIFDGALEEQPKVEEIPVITTADRPARVTGKKIAFFASQQTFVTDIMKDLSGQNDIRAFQGQSLDEMRDMMTWADLAWFEWCDQLIIEASKLPRTCRTLCRLHSYEAFTNMPARVNWDHVDHLLFVNESVREIFRQQVSAPIETSVIHNGLDLEKYSIPDEKPHSKKIASVGYINYKKNPALLLYCFKKLHRYDQEFTLHVAGTHQDPRLKVYFDHFLKNNPLPVYFDGWIDDMPGWYADKGFVISTSLFESFHYSIAEGMASGLVPLIHNWYGAEKLYPQRFMFNDPDECLDLVKSLESVDINQMRAENRQFVAGRYDNKEKTAEISALLARLTSNQITGI